MYDGNTLTEFPALREVPPQTNILSALSQSTYPPKSTGRLRSGRQFEAVSIHMVKLISIPRTIWTCRCSPKRGSIHLYPPLYLLTSNSWLPIGRWEVYIVDIHLIQGVYHFWEVCVNFRQFLESFRSDIPSDILWSSKSTFGQNGWIIWHGPFHEYETLTVGDSTDESLTKISNLFSGVEYFFGSDIFLPSRNGQCYSEPCPHM